MKEEKESIFETRDIGLAAYCWRVKKMKMVNYFYKGNTLICVFQGTEEIKNKLRLDFICSESKEFDGGIRDLKKMLR